MGGWVFRREMMHALLSLRYLVSLAFYVYSRVGVSP